MSVRAAKLPIRLRDKHTKSTTVKEQAAGTADGAILEDYGKGLFTQSTIRKLMKTLLEAKVPVAVPLTPTERIQVAPAPKVASPKKAGV